MLCMMAIVVVRGVFPCHEGSSSIEALIASAYCSTSGVPAPPAGAPPDDGNPEPACLHCAASSQAGKGIGLVSWQLSIVDLHPEVVQPQRGGNNLVLSIAGNFARGPPVKWFG